VRFLRLYEEDKYVRREIDRIAKLVRDGSKVALKCYCAPKECHGDNYIKKINEINAAYRTRRVIEEEEI
jgi:hypothetical protein